MSSSAEADVLVVGAGPVGLVTACLLGQLGHSVTVLERRPQSYPMPRAVHLDAEVAQVLAACGIGEALDALGEPATEYEWLGASGQLLLRFDWALRGPSGWPNATMLHQPDLERALRERVSALDSVRAVRGVDVSSVRPDGDEVVAVAGDTAYRARYLVGCDGANSVVAPSLGAARADLGFSYDWLIVDVVPLERRDWTPINVQHCDPARPVSAVSGGPGRRRFEFMRLPGESLDALNSSDAAWDLLKPFDVHPGNARLERHTVYTFRAAWWENWRSGRLLVAGDAAHLMPPFAGQGLCAGVRDAANLTWKLDRVLRGTSPDSLLDTYPSERVPHLRRAVEMSVALGQIICVTDPSAAAERDANLALAGTDGNALEKALPPAVLGPGLHERSTPAGLLFDGWVDVSGEPVDGGVVVRGEQLRPAGLSGLAAVVVRPDGYVYGGVPTEAELPALLAGYAARLS